MLHGKGNFQRFVNTDRKSLQRNVFGYCIDAGSITVNDAFFPANFFTYQFFEHLQIELACLPVFRG